MAYGNGQGQAPRQNNFVKKPTGTAVPSTTAATGDAPKERLSIFKAFLNKNGNGYSTKLKEDVLIPAGTRVAIFEDKLTGKDGTEYQVLNVKKMKDRVET